MPSPPHVPPGVRSHPRPCRQGWCGVPTAALVLVAACLHAPATAAAGHGGSIGSGGAFADPSPAADAMAVFLLALVALLTAGFGLLALHLRRRAANPCPVAELLDSLEDEGRSPTRPAGSAEPPANDGPWTRPSDWWKSDEEAR